MTREELIISLVEGYTKDVLTYDLSQHRPRPHQRFRFNNAARRAKEKAREVFRNKPKGRYDTQPISVSKYMPKGVKRRVPGISLSKSYRQQVKTSSARRTSPSVRQQRGRKAVLAAAGVAGVGMAAHKLYKQLQKYKKEMREALIDCLVESNLGDFSVAPTAAVDASLTHKEQRDRYWEIKNRKKIRKMTI